MMRLQKPFSLAGVGLEKRVSINLISTFAHDKKSSLTIIGGFVLGLLHKTEIFDAFHRVKAGEKEEGLGLGPAAVKTIVKAHGGRVLVESSSSSLTGSADFIIRVPEIGGCSNKGNNDPLSFT